jgi:hypothetical protein
MVDDFECCKIKHQVLSTDHELIPQEMRVLRQCMVSRAEVIFVTAQHENIRPLKKEINKAVTMLKLLDVFT